MVSDVATEVALLEIVGSNMGKAQCIIQLSNGQESDVGIDGSSVKFQTGFGVELESERGLVGVTQQVLLELLRYLRKYPKLMSVLPGTLPNRS